MVLTGGVLVRLRRVNQSGLKMTMLLPRKYDSGHSQITSIYKTHVREFSALILIVASHLVVRYKATPLNSVGHTSAVLGDVPANAYQRVCFTVNACMRSSA
jgi:hypothetical protein